MSKNKISENEAFDIAIKSGATDYLQINNFYEVVTKKEDFYKIKTELEKKIDSFAYSTIEWRAQNYLNLNNF